MQNSRLWERDGAILSAYKAAKLSGLSYRTIVRRCEDNWIMAKKNPDTGHWEIPWESLQWFLERYWQPWRLKDCKMDLKRKEPDPVVYEGVKPKEWYSTSELETIFGRCRSTILAWLNSGELTGHKQRKRWIVSDAEVRAFAERMDFYLPWFMRDESLDSPDSPDSPGLPSE